MQSNPLTEVPAGTTLVIPKGDSVTVASDNTLIINGTVWVEGTLNGSAGTVTVGGTLAKLTKAYIQKGQNNETGASALPRNPYGTKMYWVTSVETVSGVSVDGATASSFVRVTNGKGGVYRAVISASSPAAIICSVDSSVAINHITGITDTSKTKIGDTFSTSLSQLALLMSNQTFSSNAADAGNEHGILDGASAYSFTYSPKNSTAGYKQRILNSSYNCTVSSNNGGYYGNCEFYNCTGITIKNFVGKNSAAQLHVYDCTDASYITGFNETSPLNGTINYYSGGPYKTSNFKTNYEGYYHIYGGVWTTKPVDERIASSMTSTHKFYQHEDGYWYLEPKGDEVMNIDGVEYKDMAAALAAVSSELSSKSSVTLSIIKNCTISSPITVPSGKTLDFELAGCCVTAPSGLFVNNGTLYVGDQNANLKGTEGGRVVTSDGNWLVNNGTADVTYGHYTGNVLLKGGSLVTHHGYFNGNLNADSGVTAKNVVDLKGGNFTQDVTSLLKEGYYRTRNYVGKFPKPTVSKVYSDGYWKYTFKTLPDYELGLYNNTATSKKGYSKLADWQRRAEVMSMVQPWIDAHYSIDVVSGFDRAIGKSGATAHVSKPSFVGDQSLDRNVGPQPGDLYRILAPQIANPSSSLLKPGEQKYYTAFLTDSTFKELVFGISESDTANCGTTLNLRIDFCSGAIGTDISKLQSYYAIMSEYAVMGAGETNQAMIQPASGAATFYATVAEAAAAAKGGMVKLCNDIDGSITVARECSLDVNGMNVSGEITAASGFTMTVEDAKPTVETYLDKNHKVYTFVAGDFTLTVPSVDHTKVSVSVDDQVVGIEATDYAVKAGQRVVVVYTPAEGYELTNGTIVYESVPGDIAVPAPTVTATKYAISYELADGVNHPDNPATYTIEDAVTLKDPTRTGYVFAGWTPLGTIPAGSTDAKSFTAHWKVQVQAGEAEVYVMEDGTHEVNAEGAVTATDMAKLDKSTVANVAVTKQSTTEIGKQAFARFTSLEEVTVGGGVTNISTEAFSRCYALTNVMIGANVKCIASRAFASCRSLEKIAFEGEMPDLGEQAIVFYTAIRMGSSGAEIFTVPDITLNGKPIPRYGSTNLTDWVEITAPEDYKKYNFFKVIAK